MEKNSGERIENALQLQFFTKKRCGIIAGYKQNLPETCIFWVFCIRETDILWHKWGVWFQLWVTYGTNKWDFYEKVFSHRTSIQPDPASG